MVKNIDFRHRGDASFYIVLYCHRVFTHTKSVTVKYPTVLMRTPYSKNIDLTASVVPVAASATLALASTTVLVVSFIVLSEERALLSRIICTTYK